jgi:hypothetical protein
MQMTTPELGKARIEEFRKTTLNLHPLRDLLANALARHNMGRGHGQPAAPGDANPSAPLRRTRVHVHRLVTHGH